MAAEQLCGESCKDMEYSSRRVTRTGYFVHKFQKPLFDYKIRATGTIFDLDKRQSWKTAYV